MVLSTGVPSGAFSRYFMSQICWEIEATLAICRSTLYRRERPLPPDGGRPPPAPMRKTKPGHTGTAPRKSRRRASEGQSKAPVLFPQGGAADKLLPRRRIPQTIPRIHFVPISVIPHREELSTP